MTIAIIIAVSASFAAGLAVAMWRRNLAAAWSWLRPSARPDDVAIDGLRFLADGAEAQLVGARVDGSSVLLDCLTTARRHARTFTLRVPARESSSVDIREWLASDLWVGVVLLREQGRRCVRVSDGVTDVVLPPREPIG